MDHPPFHELPENLKKVLDPQKPKQMAMIAKGVAPLPPEVLVPAWCYLEKIEDAEIAAAAKKSLDEYPEKMILPVLKMELPAWALFDLGIRFLARENFIEAILLNEFSPDEVFLEAARVCSEKITILISNNQERIIQAPLIVKALEANPKNLKSSTDRLKHFLHLAGIQIPGEVAAVADAPVQEAPPTPENESDETAEEDAESADIKQLSKVGSSLTDAEKQSLLQYISKLSIGGRIKIAMKGNKEVRQILIRDTNKIISLAVLKSPRLSDNEIVHYSALRNVSDDVIRTIATNPTWSKLYQVKYNLCFHPKAPLQQTMSFMKFLNFRDLGRLAKDRNIPGPLKKAAKELAALKRK